MKPLFADLSANHCTALKAEKHSSLSAAISARKLERKKSIFMYAVLVKPQKDRMTFLQGPEETT